MSCILNMAEVQEVISSHLSSSTPFALSRCGDGEAIVLDGTNQEISHRLTSYMGYAPNKSHIRTFRKNLIETYKSSDVVGVYPHWVSGRKGARWWGEMDIIMEKHCGPIEKICDSNIHTSFLITHYYKKLLENRKRIFYVSCRDLDIPLRKRYHIEDVRSFIVAPEIRFDPNYVGVRHFPTQYHRVKRWIEKQDCRGALCLVGGGWIGKIYTIWFKKQGGIALDIGSVFDWWAGRATRGPSKGPYKEDNTCKL